MSERARRRGALGVVAVYLALVGSLPGCAMVPRERLEESRGLAQSLRAENARLKDEVVNLRAQNQDYADRALDDLRRLTARDEAIERLRKSVQGYQDDRDRLAASYRRLATSLGRTTVDTGLESTARWSGDGRAGGDFEAAETPAGNGDVDQDRAAPPLAPGGSGP